VSLEGEADFHALEAAGDLLYGYDSVTGRLMVSSDRRDWHTLGRVQVADLAADPSDPTRVLATTADGVVAYHADGGPERLVDEAPPLMLLDWPTADLHIGVSADGDVYRSSDGGGSWQRTDEPPAPYKPSTSRGRTGSSPPMRDSSGPPTTADAGTRSRPLTVAGSLP